MDGDGGAHLGHEMPVVGPGVRTGMPIRMDNPREVGADWLVNAVAAFERLGGPCVVVDFGTAITYDCVGQAGEYIGGIIAPGVEISLEALTQRAAAIPKIDGTPPRGYRQVDGGSDRRRRDLRLRGPGRRDRWSVRATSPPRRPRRLLPRALGAIGAVPANRSTTLANLLLMLTGPRAEIWERNREP